MHTHRILNIGILAHVDAGKTSLTERLLFDTGTIDTLGSVDAGTTQTDTGQIERQRGITVRSTVVSFTHRTTQVNVIDTPGHTDFVAEVDRALDVLDAAVLVISAVAGVQSHTRALMRILRAAKLPTLIFVNKIDRHSARADSLVAEIRQQLTPHVVAMTTVRSPGNRSAQVVAESLADNAFRDRVAERIADVDDHVLARVVDGPPLTSVELVGVLSEQIADARIYPLYFGSARTGHGIAPLVDGITQLLPSSRVSSEPALTPRGIVFALERSAAGTKTAYLRLFAGTVTVRQRLDLEHRDHDGTLHRHSGRITSCEVVGRTGVDSQRLTAGDIGRITGLPQIRVGDRLAGADGPDVTERRRHFAMPILRAVVRPRSSSNARLHAALRLMAEHDPLLHIQREPDGASSILLYGEIQRQIIAATLARDFGIDADFQAGQPLCIERVTGVGHAVEEMGHRAPSPSGFWATVGLRVEPAPARAGVSFRRETRLGALPRAFHRAIEESVHTRLRHGPAGRTITDCLVTLTHTGFAGPVTTTADFRGLTPIVLDHAIRIARTQLLEPYHRFEIDIPADTFTPVTAYLATLATDIDNTTTSAHTWQIRGAIPARHVGTAQQQLVGLTHGDGIWWSEPADYRPTTNPAPYSGGNETHTATAEIRHFQRAMPNHDNG
ncbi:TetM/TetW/TetO/TetS family tetracycline resistance ribosomal protection protein [Nocardia sp. NBC_01499]|uniref:GTP-binding protein n=1 Tax=Nocardia sp. NBC_01499 TaxID=2903597 RepID=UPI00386CCD5D